MASHPKIAKVRPRREADRIEAELSVARSELQAATISLRALQCLSGNAMSDWLAACPPPSAEAVHRHGIAKAQAERLARVARGETPEPEPEPIKHQSPIDLAFANRGKRGAARPVTRALKR
jgi:hypothetical protein